MKLPRVDQRWGNCYVASEALYHILGGRRSGWVPMRIRIAPNCVHWFLKHRETGLIIDPASRQFTTRGWHKKPDYSKARGSGFLTKWPSERARDMMNLLTWSLPWSCASKQELSPSLRRTRPSSASRKANRSTARSSRRTSSPSQSARQS